MHGQRLEVRLAQHQVPDPAAGVVVVHDVADRRQLAPGQGRGIGSGRADRGEQGRGGVGAQRGEDGGVATGQPGGERGEKCVPADGFDALPRRGHGLVDGEVADADQDGRVSQRATAAA